MAKMIFFILLSVSILGCHSSDDKPADGVTYDRFPPEKCLEIKNILQSFKALVQKYPEQIYHRFNTREAEIYYIKNWETVPKVDRQLITGLAGRYGDLKREMADSRCEVYIKTIKFQFDSES